MEGGGDTVQEERRRGRRRRAEGGGEKQTNPALCHSTSAGEETGTRSERKTGRPFPGGTLLVLPQV